VNGVAVADPQGAIAGSRAWATARQQIETTYKAQLDQAETRRTALAAELNPLVQAFQTARSAPTPTKRLCAPRRRRSRPSSRPPSRNWPA
jgi:hypothetical protein